MTSPAPTSLTLGAALPGEQFAAAGAAALRVIADLQEEANSPDKIKAAIAKKKLAALDALVVAQQKNDLEAERKAFENVQNP